MITITLDHILMPLTLLVLFIASYTDLRNREVPDWLNYSFLFAALGIRFLFGFYNGFFVLLSGIIGLAVCFIIAFLFYQTDQWGGGDSKLLMGLGVVIGIDFPLTEKSVHLFWFLLALLFLGSLYGLTWMLGMAVKKRSLFYPEFRKKIHQYRVLHRLLIAGTVIMIPSILFLPPLLWIIMAISLGMFYLLLFVGTMEEHFFLKIIPPQKLTEGDWLAEDIVINGRTFMDKKTIEKNDLQRIFAAAKEHKINAVTIKEGVPFIPSFLFAYIFIILGKSFIEKTVAAFF